MSQWDPLGYVSGFLPIEEHGLIGDGATAALVGRDGAPARALLKPMTKRGEEKGSASVHAAWIRRTG